MENNEIRLAVFTTTFPPLGGGVETVQYNLYHELKNNFDVKIFAYYENRGQLDVNVVREKVPIFMEKTLSHLLTLYIRRKDPYGNAKQCTIIARNAYGVLRLNRALKAYNPDLVLIPDHGLPAYFMQKPKHCKVVWFAHHHYMRFRDQPLINGTSWMDIDVASSMERRALRKADWVVSPSQYMKNFLSNGHISDLPVSIIPNIVHEETLEKVRAFPLHEHLYLNTNVPIVYIPSAGSPLKGKRYVFEIVRRLILSCEQEVAFFLSGHIPSDLMFELNRLKSDVKIHAPGRLSWHENLKRIKACKICVSPTIAENLSMAFIEALFFGLPVITFDVGGNREIVTEGTNGYVVPYLGVDQLINKAMSLIKSEKLLEKFSANAFQYTRQKFNSKKIITKYLSLFSTILHEK